MSAPVELLRLYSRLPTFRGKNWLGQKFMNALPLPKQVRQTMAAGFQMDLMMSDRIQRWMFVTRHHEPETETIFEAFARKSRVMLDVGGNIGYMSLLAKQVNPRLKIYAFEPLPGNVITFRANIALNGFQDLAILETCVSDQVGETEFLLPPGEESGWGRIAYRDDLFKGGGKISREVTTLDEFTKTHGEKIDLIKIDVEGFETKVLHGARKLLARDKPVICFEVNEPCLKDVGTSSREIFDFLHSLGYSIHAVHKSPELTEVEDALDNYEYLNYFAVARKN